MPIASDIKRREVILKRLTRVSKVLSVFFVVWAVLSLCASGLTIWYSITSALESNQNLADNILYILKVIFSHAAQILIPLMIASIFHDISQGNSPFSNKQSRRFMVLGLVLLISVLLQAFAPADPNVRTQLAEGFVELGSGNRPENRDVFFVDTALLFSSIICFCLSLIFKYGALLQELADETV